MKTIAALILSLLFSSLTSSVAQNKSGESSSGSSTLPTQVAPCVPEVFVPQTELRTLAEGQQSKIKEPFIAVVRDLNTYNQLRRQMTDSPNIDELPVMLDEDFKRQTVIAAFLGERNTAGYGINVVADGRGGIRLAETKPPKNAMVAQVITAPFKVIAINAPAKENFPLDFDYGFARNGRHYVLRSGSFTYSGGIAGRQKSYELSGGLIALRQGDLLTVMFTLDSKGADKQRSLNVTASGIISVDATFNLPFFPSATLVETPAAPLSANGVFQGKGETFKLKFKALPTIVADGFSGEGEIQAELSKQPYSLQIK